MKNHHSPSSPDIDVVDSGPLVRRSVSRISWVPIAAGVVASVTLGAGVAGAGLSRPANTTPASVRSIGTALPANDESGYVECMRSVGGSADAAEHWVDACHQLAPVLEAARAALVACVREAATADVAERRCSALTKRP